MDYEDPLENEFNCFLFTCDFFLIEGVGVYTLCNLTVSGLFGSVRIQPLIKLATVLFKKGKSSKSSS